MGDNKISQLISEIYIDFILNYYSGGSKSETVII